MDHHGLPEETRQRLAVGVLEAHVVALKAMLGRTTGEAFLVLSPEHGPGGTTPPTNTAPNHPPPKPTDLVLSTLLDDFARWARQSGGWRGGSEAQALVSLRLFAECAGDRPVETYTRRDADGFRDTLRQLPAVYRKSKADRALSLSQLIERADATSAPRLTDKTAKRHFWAVSRFFAFLTETGRLPTDAENPARGFTFNTRGPARAQREMWRGVELQALFLSPVWTGCHPYFRIRPGSVVIRDALFWLPLLGLFHGNRLEEFAQLRREDIGLSEGVWFLRITDADGRQLKNEQSRRNVPLHSELIRLGFLDHVAAGAPSAGDSVFPDLSAGGSDRKLGYDFTKRFSAYRQGIGLRRRGLDYHSFRHGVTTKLYEADVNEGWIDMLTGHTSGGESRSRYLKGVPLAVLRGAVERVRWPELDLSKLYVRDVGDERWPLSVTSEAA